MPLLRKQPFQKQNPPFGLKLDDEGFYCKITNEIFTDYELFFERIILCNSLVWSCSITGRSGMTFEEAKDCEEKARRDLATFQEELQRSLLYIAGLTHRSRLADLNDDVFLFAKERYFIGEIVDAIIGGSRVPAKVLKVIFPKTQSSQNNGDVIIIDDNSDSGEYSKRELPAADKMMYVVQPLADKSSQVMLKAPQISRKKGVYTRDKSRLFLKQNCEIVKGVWSPKESMISQLYLKEAKFEDFYSRPKPSFVDARMKNASKNCQLMTGSTPGSGKKSSSSDAAFSAGRTLTVNSESADKCDVLNGPDSPEWEANRESERLERVAERVAKQQEMKQKMEEEKQRKKEEREKERDKKREEKKQEIAKLKEWNRPREDMACDDLKPLPELKPLKSLIPGHLFGDAVMILECVNAFKSVFDFKQFFPKGFTWSVLETATMEQDPQGPLCELIQMLLCALFNLQEGEAEEYQELEKEAKDELGKRTAVGGGDDDALDDDDQVSNNELIRSATMFAQYPQHTFGIPLKDILLDQFTLSEVLRLHLLSSGARANSKNARFRYQQRGGYSSLDDPGVELRKQDVGLMRRLQMGNVFDLLPDDKIRLVATLVQQVMTYATVRDIIEETYDKLRVKKYDFKLLQWAELRRIRDDQVSCYKRMVEEKAKEREYRLKQMARAEIIRQAKEKGEKGPTFSPLNEPASVTPEQRQLRDDKQKADEVKKRADYHKRELDALQQILDLQRCNALHPLGRDRHHRRYWLFPALPAFMVESELIKRPPFVDAGGGGFRVGNIHLSSLPTANHNISSVNENCSPAVNSTPQGDCDNLSDNNSEGGDQDETPSDNEGSLRQHPDDVSIGAVRAIARDGCSGVEGDVDMTEAMEDLSDVSNGSDRNYVGHRETVDRDSGGWVGLGPEQAKLRSPASTRWFLVDSLTMFAELLESFNRRGFRESCLLQYLQDTRPLLELLIQACPKSSLCLDQGDNGSSAERRHTRASEPLIADGNTLTDSASEAMEMTLRDGLLDLEDRIFVGSLGSMKVKDRSAWRHALECGGYSPQTDDSLFAGISTVHNDRINADSYSTPGVIPEELVARDLCHALVQIAHGIDLRFLAQPLGDADRKKSGKEDRSDGSVELRRRSALYGRWEDSTLACCSLSQVFLHLAALDNSIKWDRSAMLTSCRVCRRKCNPEKTLLCDKCDSGFHIYCLKPPMTKVPSGDWFCPYCQPRVPPPSCQKKRRRAFCETDDDDDEGGEEEDELGMEFEGSVEDKRASDEDEDETPGESNEDEQMTEVDSDEVENEDMCAECHQDGTLIMCDVCPRSYHLHCTRPQLKKVPKGKWMCQVCVGGGRAGKIQFARLARSTALSDVVLTAKLSGEPLPKKERQSTEIGSVMSGSQRPTGRFSLRQETTHSAPNQPGKKASSDGSVHRGRPAGGRRRKYRRRTDTGVTPTTSMEASGPRLKRCSSLLSQLSQDDSANKIQCISHIRYRTSPLADAMPLPRLRRKTSVDSPNTPEVLTAIGWLSDAGRVSQHLIDFEVGVRQYTSSKRGNSQVQKMHAVEGLLQELIRHQEAWPFCKPVDKKLVPDYYDVIECPMDLSTIRNKVHAYQYSSPSQLIDDVNLIFDNCVEYNARTTPEYRAGLALSKFFAGRIHDLGLQDGGGVTKKQRT